MALLNVVSDVKNVLIVMGAMGFVMKLLFHLQRGQAFALGPEETNVPLVISM